MIISHLLSLEVWNQGIKVGKGSNNDVGDSCVLLSGVLSPMSGPCSPCMNSPMFTLWTFAFLHKILPIEHQKWKIMIHPEIPHFNIITSAENSFSNKVTIWSSKSCNVYFCDNRYSTPQLLRLMGMTTQYTEVIIDIANTLMHLRNWNL